MFYNLLLEEKQFRISSYKNLWKGADDLEDEEDDDGYDYEEDENAFWNEDEDEWEDDEDDEDWEGFEEHELEDEED